MDHSRSPQQGSATVATPNKIDNKPKESIMKSMNINQGVKAFAVIGTAALLSAFSLGTSAKAASYSTTCQTLSGILGPCCNRMMGSQLLNVYGDCHNRKDVIKRKVRVPPVVVLRLLPLESEREGGGGNGGGDKGKSPNSLR
jgi:hypothetical protein